MRGGGEACGALGRFLYGGTGKVCGVSIWKKKKGETEYGIGWVPFGGYVKIAGMIDESMNGATNAETLCDTLLPIVEEDWRLVLSKLMTIKDIIFDEYFTRSGMVINLTGDKQVLSAIESDVKSFLNDLPGNSDSTMSLQNFCNTKHPW